MKNLLYTILALLLFVGLTNGSELGTLEALIADGTSEIDTTLENVRGGVADLVTDIGGWSAWDTTEIDFGDADWLDVATSQWLAITGYVDLEVAFYCSTNVGVTSADTLNITDEGGTVLGSWMGEDINAGEWLLPTTGIAHAQYSETPLTYWRGNILRGVFAGEINGVISDHVFSSGIIIVCWRYRDAPFYTGGSVASGNGGTP